MSTLNSIIKSIFVGIGLFANLILFAGNSDISFRRITINDGLSLSSVYCIYQDSRGFMWFSTEDGLNKYDGKNFRIYNHSAVNPNSLTNKWVESIVEDKYGNLWLGTRHGLTRLDPKSDHITQFIADPEKRNTISNDTIVSLLAHNDHIWVGTMNGLNRIHIETLDVETLSLECNPSRQKINTLYLDKKKRIWIGTNGGLYVKTLKKDKLTCLVSSLPENEILNTNSIFVYGDTLLLGTQNSLLKYILKDSDELEFMYPAIQAKIGHPLEEIFQDSRNKIWLLTGPSIYTYESKQIIKIIDTPNPSPSLAINPKKPILEDSNGNIWIGTFGDGIYKVQSNDSRIVHYRHDPADPTSLSDNTINSIFEDRSKGIWVGTFGSGISVFDPFSNLIKTLRHSAYDSQSMSSSFVWSIQELQNGKVWIGTNATGINIYDPKSETFDFLIHNPDIKGSLPAGAVREVFQSQQGVIWVGTDGGGLSKYDPKSKEFQNYTHRPEDPSSISSNSVRTIFEDSTGILWVGTRNGLNKFNPNTGKFISYLHDPNNQKTISNNFVYSAIYMDKRGYLWIGTYGGGLNRMDPNTGKFIRFQFDPDDISSISDDIVFSIYEDEKGYFWIGTNSGLNLFNPSTGKFKRYGLESGLPNEVIYGIVPDKNNRLWLTTNKGVSRLDLTEFRFKNLDVRDGLQSNEFNGGAIHGGKSGLIYTGGVYGLSIIDPEKITPVKNMAELIISRLEILGKDVKVLEKGMFVDSTQGQDRLVELVENYYLPMHVTYLDVVRLNYKQRFFSIEFAALNHHLPEKLNYRYRMQNLEDHWNNTGTRNYVTYANMKPGTYIFEVDASNTDGFLTEKPAQLKIVISPPFWRSYAFMLLMAMIAILIIVFIYRFLLNQRTNKILIEQNEQIRVTNNQLRISENILKELNATKDKFFSIISHDLKNPFASVMSISELLDQNFSSTDKDELKYGVKKIHETNKHIYELLENLLTWSKTQRGNLDIEKVRFNLSKLIETNINILKLAAEKKNIQLTNNVNENIYAFADREMISTIIRNLLNNAVKFTHIGKEISIYATLENNSVKISIKDQGTGISTENVKRLFRIDDKFKSNGTEGEKGTGLGLIICKEFVEKNEGKIDVQSEQGKGSTFSITIPVGE